MKKIYLIDASSFIYRMFYWVPEMRTKSWEVVNAIYWMARFFLLQMKQENPDYLIFVKDAKWKNFRHKLDENYKATRDKMPDNLRSQLPVIYDMIEKMWIPSIEMQGYEADDIIGTLATKYNWNKDYKIDILSWDKDLYSLVSENVSIYDTMKKKRFSVKETIEKFWVEPKMIIDYLAIVWDKSDNIPGIDWFGPKKAIILINEIWSIEKIYELLDSWNFENLSDEVKKIFKWKNLEKLEKSRENAFLSKKLATIETNVYLENFDLEKFKFFPEKYLTDEVKYLFKKLEFNSLLWEEMPKLKKWEDLNLKVKIIWDDEWLNELFEKIAPPSPPFKGGNIDKIVFDTETTSLDIIKAEIVWISIYLDEKNIFYINRMHRWAKVSDKKLKEFLNKLFDLDITIIGHNLKYDLEIVDLFLENKKTKEKSILKDSWQMTLL